MWKQIGCVLFAVFALANCQSCRPPGVSDGRIYTSSSFDGSGAIASGGWATLVCPNGSPNGISKSQCLNGRWQSQFGSCGGVSGSNSGSANSATTTIRQSTRMCYSSPIDNGVIMASTGVDTSSGRVGHLPGTTLNLICNPGYSVLGQSSSYCRIDALWTQRLGNCVGSSNSNSNSNNQVPASQPITSTCLIPPADHGTIILSNAPKLKMAVHLISSGTQITVVCDDGYQLTDGVDTVVCNGRGEFSDALGTCTPASSTDDGSGAAEQTVTSSSNLRTVILYADTTQADVPPWLGA